MTTAIKSALTGKTVRHDVAMTGEVTLRGRVLAIGGLKEKTLAAYRSGIKTVIIPFENKRDYDELPDVVKDNIKFVFAKNMETVLENALTDSSFSSANYIDNSVMHTETAICTSNIN